MQQHDLGKIAVRVEHHEALAGSEVGGGGDRFRRICVTRRVPREGPISVQKAVIGPRSIR